MYTNYSLGFALKHKKKFDITIELIQDEKPNAYLYDDVIAGSELFGKWYETLIQIKQKYPKNKLIKHIMSAMWGMLCSHNYIYKNEEQIEKENLQIGITESADYEIIDYIDNGTKPYYKLVNKKHPYKYNIRVKPFLSSYARIQVAEVAMKNVDSVIRIQTDSIVYDKPIEHNLPNLIAEGKTSGTIYWKNCNHARHICSTCGGKYEYKDRDNHVCTK
jgi:hypothetical protein